MDRATPDATGGAPVDEPPSGAPTAPTGVHDPGACPSPVPAWSGPPSEGFTGLNFLQFEPLRPSSLTPPEALEAGRRDTGTVEQVLDDVERLGVSHLRDLGDADATLRNLWRGCFAYTPGNPDDPGNAWSTTAGGGLDWGDADPTQRGGWACHPASLFDDGAGSLGPNQVAWSYASAGLGACRTAAVDGYVPGDVDPALAIAACRAPDQAPAVNVALVQDLARAAAKRGMVLVPRILGRSDRSDAASDPCDLGHESYLDWEWVDDLTGTMHSDRPGDAHFTLGSVDDYDPARAGSNEDNLAWSFTAQLLGGAMRDAWSDPSEYTPPAGVSQVPYLLVGNEFDQVTCADKIAWFILRTSLHLIDVTDDGTGTDALDRGLKRIFPSLYSPNNGRATQDDPTLYIHGSLVAVETVFFQLVRAAMVLSVDADAGLVPSDPTLKDRVGRAFGAGGGVPAPDLSVLFEDVAEAIELAGGVRPSHPRELGQVESQYDLELTEVALAARASLRAPFDVMDFHWYNNDFGSFTYPDGTPVPPQGGKFLYLSKLYAYVLGPSGLRDTLIGWWSNGRDLPLWCSETGIASHKTWKEFKRIMARWSDPVVGPYSCAPTDLNMSWTRLGPGDYSPEFRVDPVKLKQELGPAILTPEMDMSLGNSPPDRDNWESWPDWAFTSELEQARQVWMRLSYLAALGLQKAFWWSYQGEVWQQGCGAKVNQFYSYGLNLDTEDVADTTPAGCGEASLPACVSAEEARPLLERRKKMAFCALRRWNQFLDRFQSAEFVAARTPAGDSYHLDGNGTDPDAAEDEDGFYAVLFLRSEEGPAYLDPAGGLRFPYALVAWADAQAYDWPHPFPPPAPGRDRAPPPSRTLTLTFVPADPSGPEPVGVPTVPGLQDPEFPGAPPVGPEYAGHLWELHPGGPPACNPCLEQGLEDVLGDAFDEPIDAPRPESGYASDLFWKFPKARRLPSVAGGYEVTLQVDADPLLVLLPPGQLWMDGAVVHDLPEP